MVLLRENHCGFIGRVLGPADPAVGEEEGGSRARREFRARNAQLRYSWRCRLRVLVYFEWCLKWEGAEFG